MSDSMCSDIRDAYMHGAHLRAEAAKPDGVLVAEGVRAAVRMETAADAKAYLDGNRARERMRLAAMPEWERRFEGLLDGLPEEVRRAAVHDVVLLLNSLCRAATIAPHRLARELVDRMGAEVCRMESEDHGIDSPA